MHNNNHMSVYLSVCVSTNSTETVGRINFILRENGQLIPWFCLLSIFHELGSKFKVTSGHWNLQWPVTLLILVIETRAVAQNERIWMVYNLASYLFQLSLNFAVLRTKMWLYAYHIPSTSSFTIKLGLKTAGIRLTALVIFNTTD